MKISYNQFDDVNRQFQLVNGVYSIEKDKNEKWIWTSTEFGGIIANIDNITLSVFSEIPNTMIYDGNSITLHPNCLSVVKIKVSGKSDFEIRLANPYVVSNDSRVLGVRIMRIVIDNDVIF